MKTIERVIVVVLIVGLAWLVLHAFGSSASQGIGDRLKSATVTARYSPFAVTNSGKQVVEKTVVIQEPARLAAIEESMRSIPTNFVPNSMIGLPRLIELPRYQMQVQYVDGRTQLFYFTRTEFGSSGRTPRRLIEELQKNGL